MYAEHLFLVCQGGDHIKCKKCQKISLANQLCLELGPKFPKSHETGRYWQVVYYYCPCDPVHPLLYNCGDGILQVVECSSAELVA